MISLELAGNLQKAGLVWEPKLLDFYIINESGISGVNPGAVCVIKTQNDIRDLKELHHMWYPRAIKTVWLPRLSQILAEIEARGYAWALRAVIDESEPGNPMLVGYWACVWRAGEQQHLSEARFCVDNKYGLLERSGREEAAAKALLWILEDKHGQN